MSTQNNLAYDLSRYERQIEKEEAYAQPAIVQRPKAKKTVSPIKAVGYAAIIAVAVFCMIASKMENSALCNQISDMNRELDIVKSENVRMQAEIDGRTSLKNVEQYATDVLGLQKLEKAQVEYVQMQKDNVIEVSEKSQNVFVKIKNKFYSVLEYLRG